jgi:hypothetical protein
MEIRWEESGGWGWKRNETKDENRRKGVKREKKRDTNSTVQCSKVQCSKVQ